MCRSEILQQTRQTTKKLPANKSLLVLGDNETGKTTLISKLAHPENTRKGSGLEYNFMEIRDEYREDTTKLGAWILDGDLKHVDLLNFALTESNFEHSCCILVASMSEPWNIMRSLEKWADVLENHIRSLNIKPDKLKQCKQRVTSRFVNYVSTNDEAESKLISKIDSNLNGSNDIASKSSVAIEEDRDEYFDAESPDNNRLSGNILLKNLGIEIIVVITHTDHISLLEKDFDYTEETFDFIQQAIRKFCLQYGASLFYVSAKVNKNCDLLYKYLAHRIYDLPFKTSASVVERDAIFVPAGWDDEKKISILYDNIKSANPDDNYNDFINERAIIGPTQRDTEVEAESDQEFLVRMQNDLGKQVQTPLPSAPSPVQPRQNLSNALDTQPTGEGALQNFFSSLLNKSRAMPPVQNQPDS